jgi:hypothetical protein
VLYSRLGTLAGGRRQTVVANHLVERFPAEAQGAHVFVRHVHRIVFQVWAGAQRLCVVDD